MRGPAVTCFRRDHFLFHECGADLASKRAGACFHAITVGVPPNARWERGAPTCHGNVCAARRGVSGEILGRDIGPQATNSYDDIDSSTESSGDVHPAISLPSYASSYVAPISTISCVCTIRPRVSAVDPLSFSRRGRLAPATPMYARAQTHTHT